MGQIASPNSSASAIYEGRVQVMGWVLVKTMSAKERKFGCFEQHYIVFYKQGLKSNGVKVYRSPRRLLLSLNSRFGRLANLPLPGSIYLHCNCGVRFDWVHLTHRSLVRCFKGMIYRNSLWRIITVGNNLTDRSCRTFSEGLGTFSHSLLIAYFNPHAC